MPDGRSSLFSTLSVVNVEKSMIGLKMLVAISGGKILRPELEQKTSSSPS
jgi:hypothetical protein